MYKKWKNGAFQKEDFKYLLFLLTFFFFFLSGWKKICLELLFTYQDFSKSLKDEPKVNGRYQPSRVPILIYHNFRIKSYWIKCEKQGNRGQVLTDQKFYFSTTNCLTLSTSQGTQDTQVFKADNLAPFQGDTLNICLTCIRGELRVKRRERGLWVAGSQFAHPTWHNRNPTIPSACPFGRQLGGWPSVVTTYSPWGVNTTQHKVLTRFSHYYFQCK